MSDDKAPEMSTNFSGVTDVRADARRLRDLGPLACGTTITYVDGQMVDDKWHPITIAHHDWIGDALNTMQRVRNLHRCHPEGIVPVCVECGRVWPCPTIQALDVA